MSGLPGRILSLPKGAMCENEGHENVPAVKCIQGETDSFGYEEFCLCQPCYDKYREEADKPKNGYCDFCKQPDAEDIGPMRDVDEGTHGPVYEVCKACRTKYNRRMQEELDQDRY
jgi:hypothetical protein